MAKEKYPNLAKLVAPCDAEMFLQNIPHPKPEVFRLKGRSFKRLFSSRKLDDLFRTQNLPPWRLQVMKEGLKLDPKDLFDREYQRDKGGGVCYVWDRQMVIKELALGATLVVNNVDFMHGGVAEFAARLAWETHSTVWANAFWGAPGSQGYPKHKDKYNVLLLQIEGSKEWRVYGKDPEELLLHTVLRPGDVLLLPPGYYHEGRTRQRTYSLHLSLGMQWVNSKQLVDRFARLLMKRGKEDVLQVLREESGDKPLVTMKKWVRETFSDSEMLNFMSKVSPFDGRYTGVSLSAWQGRKSFRKSERFRLVPLEPLNVHQSKDDPSRISYYFRGNRHYVAADTQAVIDYLSTERVCTYAQLSGVCPEFPRERLDSLLRELILQGILEAI